MLNDLLLAEAALGLRPRTALGTPRLVFQPLSPWMIEELRKRAERNRQREAPQVELPLAPPASWPVPVKDWQD
ncbi:MAG: hypothetical protein IT534_11460 [Bauldia sp.]|nr:hypothetical protein [Bauldia sp.]